MGLPVSANLEGFAWLRVRGYIWHARKNGLHIIAHFATPSPETPGYNNCRNCLSGYLIVGPAEHVGSSAGRAR